MFVIPAIDIRDGKCVRLFKGLADQQTTYDMTPAEAAVKWSSFGAGLIHVVDLDGAFGGAPVNLDALAKIKESVDVKIEFGGGLRSLDSIGKAFDAGVDRIVIGTSAVEDIDLLRSACNKWNGRIVVGVDTVDGYVATKGWTQKSGEPVIEFIKKMMQEGVDRFIHTDVSRDGTFTGPDYITVDAILAECGCKLIASGGVGSIADVVELKKRADKGLEGVIVGKALYDGRIMPEEMI